MPPFSKVLMVALRYPPAIGTGNIRTLKHQKYLPAYGWIADTLTGPLDGADSPLVQEPAREGPGVTYRVRFLDPFRVASRLDSRVARSAAAGAGARLLRLVGRYLLVPDNQALFAPAAFLRSINIGREYSAIYASGMPWSGFVAAMGLHLRLALPVVLDLRDPWIEQDGGRVGWARRRLELALEGACLRTAVAIVVTAPGLRDELARRRPALRDRIHVIPNGYDEDDFQGPPARALSGFDVVHTGIFYGTKGPSDLFEGLRRWLAGHPERRKDVRVRLVGPIRRADQEAAARCGIADIVVFDPPAPQREAVAKLRAGRVAVAVDFGPNQARTRVLSKVFEYMRSGRPILFLSSGGGTDDVLRPCPRALVVPKNDPDAVASALESIALRPQSARDFQPDPYTASFERSALAERLASILHEITKEGQPLARHPLDSSVERFGSPR